VAVAVGREKKTNRQDAKRKRTAKTQRVQRQNSPPGPLSLKERGRHEVSGVSYPPGHLGRKAGRGFYEYDKG